MSMGIQCPLSANASQPTRRSPIFLAPAKALPWHANNQNDHNTNDYLVKESTIWWNNLYSSCPWQRQTWRHKRIVVLRFLHSTPILFVPGEVHYSLVREHTTNHGYNPHSDHQRHTAKIVQNQCKHKKCTNCITTAHERTQWDDATLLIIMGATFLSNTGLIFTIYDWYKNKWSPQLTCSPPPNRGSTSTSSLHLRSTKCDAASSTFPKLFYQFCATGWGCSFSILVSSCRSRCTWWEEWKQSRHWLHCRQTFPPTRMVHWPKQGQLQPMPHQRCPSLANISLVVLHPISDRTTTWQES